jgi:hypothetical protein
MLSFQISALRWGRVSHSPGYSTPEKTAIGQSTSLADKCNDLQNDAGTPVSDRHKIDTTESRFVPGSESAKENAVSGATEHCAINRSEVTQLLANCSHVSVSKSIRYALALGTSAAWQGVILVLFARLNTAERASLAFAALSSLDDDTAYQTASLVLFGTLDGEAVR